MMMLRTLPALLLTLLLALPGAAAPATPDGAEVLTRMLRERMADSAAGSRDRARIERVPDIQITPRGEQYGVRLPKLRLLVNPEWMVEAPLVEGDATPLPDGSWQISLRLPKPLTLYGPNGFRAGDISLARQKINLRISADGRDLSAADIDVGGARFTPSMGAGTGSLAALRLILAPSIAVTGEAWTGKASLAVDGLSIRDPAGVERVALTRLRLSGTADGLDMRRMDRLLTGDRTALDRLARSADTNIDLSNAKLIRDDGSRIQVGSARGDVRLSGLMAAKSGLSLDWRHQGLETAGPAFATGSWPERAEIKATATSLPRALLAGAKPAGGWMPLLGQAGTIVNVTRISVETLDSGVTGRGNFRFNDRTPSGVTGDGDLSLRGIEQLVGGNRLAANPGLAIGLYALKGLGKPTASAGSGVTHAYRLRIGNDGKMMLNDGDATMIFKGLTAIR